MANHWDECQPDLSAHEFEIYDNISSTVQMDTFHAHDFYEFRFIKHGDITHYSENAVDTLHAGAVSVMPPGMFHRIMPSPTGSIPNYTRVLLYVSADFVHAMDTPAYRISETFDRFGYPGNQHFALSPQALDTYYLPLREIVRRQADDEPLCHLRSRSQVMLTLARLAEEIEALRSPVRQERETDLVQQVIAFINANLSASLSLDDLAERFFVSKFYLSHQFKQYTQLSLHQYVLKRRMMHAQAMLRAGSSPTAAAAACGYREYSSFYKAFLRETGHTPREFV